MTTDTRAALAAKQRATDALVEALAPLEDAADFAALWTVVRAYGAACQALGAALCADGDEPCAGLPAEWWAE
jgi:hypothetical protein